MAKAKKPKSMAILGVRGLRVHARTPGALNFALFVKVEAWSVIAEKAAVQAMLWHQSYVSETLNRVPRGQSARQSLKWQDVFNRAMKRYERDSGKPSSYEKEQKR